MTTLESGTAVNVSYPEHELRAVAIHEAGHAVTAHVYRPDLESSRLSTRMRGGSLGHHQTFEREERFSRWQHEEMGTLIHVLGAMAAENVFYGENTGGVGGDLQTATDTAAWMVGTAGMRPLRIDLDGQRARRRGRRRVPRADHEALRADRPHADEPDARQRRLPRRPDRGDPPRPLQERGRRADPRPGVRDRGEPRREQQGRPSTRSRRGSPTKRELFGDELVELLDEQQLVKPELDYTKDETWPKM